jgi:hypothetical protein
MVILTAQGDEGKANSLVRSLINGGWDFHKVHQFKVFQDSRRGLGITDNIMSVFILTEVNGEAIGFIGTLVSPIVGTYCGL